MDAGVCYGFGGGGAVGESGDLDVGCAGGEQCC